MSEERRIRVGVVVENHFPRLGGIEYCTYFLVRALNRLPGVSASVGCSDMPEVPRSFPYPYKVYMAKSFSFLTSQLYKKNVINMVRNEKIDILHGMMLHGGGASATEIGEKMGIPVVTQSHGSDVQTVPEIGYGAPLHPKSLRRVQFCLRNSDRIIAPSILNKEKIVELSALPEKITVIPNGFALEEINSVPYNNARKDYGVNEDDFLLVSTGRNRPVKRMGLLFQALALIKKETKNIKCICVGPEEDLPEMARLLSVEDMVILTGKIPQQSKTGPEFPPYQEMVHLYRAANLYISTSHVESFNNSALEALACGTPVVVTRLQGIRDVIIEGESGFTLQEDTPEALAAMLLELMPKKEELAKRRERIKNSVSHLSWNNIAKRTLEVYLSLLK